VAPPRGPRASPNHPTWWLVPLGAHHGQGGKKTAQSGLWVPPPNRIAYSENDRSAGVVYVTCVGLFVGFAGTYNDPTLPGDTAVLVG
jgi:hypothetical protein